MKLARVLGFLIILGSSVIPAYATETPIGPSSVLSDPTISIRDPNCGSDPYCVDLTYTGATGTELLAFLVPAPPGFLPANPPPYNCVTNILGATVATLEETPSEFNGCLFDGPLTNGEDVTISADGPVVLTIPEVAGNPVFTCTDTSQCPGGDIDLTPEPRTALLYMTGLVFLVGFARKRFGANFRT